MRLLFLFIGLLFLVPDIGFSQVTFSNTASYSLFGAPPVLKDIDFDNDLDLLMLEGGSPNKFRVYKNDGSGLFNNPTTITNNSATTCAFADLNNDGFEDIVAGGFTFSGFSVAYGNGIGTFGTPYNETSEPDSQQVFKFGDFNLDGWTDLVTVIRSDSPNSVLIWKNTFGTLALQNDISLAALDPSFSGYFRGLEVIDFDRDGDLDIFAGDDGGNIHLLKNDLTDFTFTKTKIISDWYGSNIEFQFLDQNNDGNYDIINTAGNIYYGTGTGTFTLGQSLWSAWYFGGILLLDLNNDNRKDILLDGGSSYGYCLQNINGGYYPLVTQSMNQGFVRFASGDLNNDGLIDFINGQGHIYTNTTTSTDLNLKVSTPSIPALCTGQVINVDYEISGLPIAGNIFTVQLSNASGSFASPTNIGTLASRAPSGTITCTIPFATTAGSGYKVRIVSSSAYSLTIPYASTFQINATPAAPNPTGITSVCANRQNVSYSTPLVAGITYAWTVPTNAAIDGTSNGNAVTLDFNNFTGGSLTVSSTNAAGCSNSGTINLTALPVPATSAISGPANVTINQTGVNYSITSHAGNSYIWTAPANATITAGAGSSQITLNFNNVVSTNNILTVVETNAQSCSVQQTLNISIEKLAQTISGLSNITKTYGDASFTLTGVASSGLTVSYLSSDPMVASISGNTISIVNAGTTNITASQAGNGSYYPASDVIISLTVDKALLTVTVDNQSKNYGEPDPAFTFAYAGFVNGENASVLNTEPIATPVNIDAGTPPIVASGGLDYNYNFTYIDGIYSISKIPLIITADDQTKTYGAANPVFTFTYSGFVNGETSSVLDVLPTATTTATSSSTPGSYPINLTGGSDNNYNYTLQDGELTIIATIGTTIDVLPRDTGMCKDETVQLDAELDNVLYRWYYKGALVSTNKQPTFSESGEYILEVEDPLGNTAQDTSNVIENEVTMVSSFLMASEAGVEDKVVAIDVSFAIPDSLTWNWGSAIAKKQGDIYILKFPSEGTFTVGLTSWLGYCAKTSSNTISIVSGSILPEEDGPVFPYHIVNVIGAPIPTNDIIYISVELREEANITLMLFDQGSNLLESWTSNEEALNFEYNIDLSARANGNYVVRVLSKEDERILKIIKSE